MLIMLGFFASLSSTFGEIESNDGDIVFKRNPGRYLGNYIIRSLKTESEFDCSYGCLNEAECVSVNYKLKGEDKGVCELNSKTLHEFPNEGQSKSEYVYVEIDSKVRKDLLILLI